MAHTRACEKLPADCLECQLYKVADGLLSGRYSVPASGDSPKSSSREGAEGGGLLHQSPTPVFQNGVRPMTLKAVIGKGHAEFSTMRQQDSEEFLSHLLNTLRRDIHKYKQQNPSEFPSRLLFNYPPDLSKVLRM